MGSGSGLPVFFQCISSFWRHSECDCGRAAAGAVVFQFSGVCAVALVKSKKKDRNLCYPLFLPEQERRVFFFLYVKDNVALHMEQAVFFVGFIVIQDSSGNGFLQGIGYNLLGGYFPLVADLVQFYLEGHAVLNSPAGIGGYIQGELLAWPLAPQGNRIGICVPAGFDHMAGNGDSVCVAAVGAAPVDGECTAVIADGIITLEEEIELIL